MPTPHANPIDDPHYRSLSTSGLLIFLVVAAVILTGRLFYLQIIEGSYHQMLSMQNSMRLQVVKSPRGLIYDRTGKVIARNRPSYQIVLQPSQLKDRAKVLQDLLRIKDAKGAPVFDSQLVAWSLDRSRWRKFQPLVILEDAPLQVVALVDEHQTDMPGVAALVESRRSYPYGPAAGNVLGYMDQVNEDEIEDSKSVPGQDSGMAYSRGDRVGRKGLEEYYEDDFRGRDGVRYVKVNAFGREMDLIHDMPQFKPIPGRSIHTTLDVDLQCYAESLLTDSVRGSIVAIDPRNGEILVMASAPRMDGNIFSLNKGLRGKQWAKLVMDPSRPLNNRAIAGGYEPGSTFKGIVSIAALQSGKITADTRMPRGCTGGYRFGNRVWKCWNPNGHGSLSMIDAFTVSCDVYYYQAGLQIGMDPINRVAREFGFGQKTNVDLEDERSGSLMDSGSYTAQFSKRGWRWSNGMILNLSIGQGEIATPLQLANYAAGLANGHVLYRPHLMKEITDEEGKVVSRAQSEILHQITMTDSEHATLLEAMAAVVNSPHGTAARARVPGILVGGKTGTAESSQGAKNNALFICAAPLDHPTIAIAVVIENIGHGGTYSAPIAGALLKRYFHVEPHG